MVLQRLSGQFSCSQDCAAQVFNLGGCCKRARAFKVRMLEKGSHEAAIQYLANKSEGVKLVFEQNIKPYMKNSPEMAAVMKNDFLVGRRKNWKNWSRSSSNGNFLVSAT